MIDWAASLSALFALAVVLFVIVLAMKEVRSFWCVESTGRANARPCFHYGKLS
jgi:hypothetical protein